MAFFVRASNPPQYQRYKSYKRHLRLDFRFRCAYCEVTEGYLRGPDAFGADHFKPFKHFPELDCAYQNLYYCCNQCNAKKRAQWPSVELQEKGIGFADPCVEDPYTAHLLIQPSGDLAPSSKIGSYTLEIIRLNREECRRFRTKRIGLIATIREYRSVLAEHDGPEEIVDSLHRALDRAEAEWAELFA